MMDLAIALRVACSFSLEADELLLSWSSRQVAENARSSNSSVSGVKPSGVFGSGDIALPLLQAGAQRSLSATSARDRRTGDANTVRLNCPPVENGWRARLSGVHPPPQ